MAGQSFTLGSIEAKNLIASDKTFLIALEVDVKDIDNPSVIVETLYLVSNNEDITLGGNLYTAFPFQIDFHYEAGSLADFKVSAKDVTRDLQSRMQLYNGGVGFDVRMKVYHQDSTNDPADFEEQFQIISSSTSDYTVNWQLGSENLLDRKFPSRHQYRDRCSWSYKSDECGYSGTIETCDYTLGGTNGCKAHNNTLNFGGFPGLRSG
jgi:phage-related protein